MVALSPCTGCRFGKHEDHVSNYAPAPPGVIGGFMCPCRGDCAETTGADRFSFCFAHGKFHECDVTPNPEPPRVG